MFKNELLPGLLPGYKGSPQLSSGALEVVSTSSAASVWFVVFVTTAAAAVGAAERAVTDIAGLGLDFLVVVLPPGGVLHFIGVWLRCQR